MQNVELTNEEAEVLRELLRHHVAEMDVEVGRTDTWDFKMMLKHRREVLEKTLSKLEQPVPA